MILIGTECAHDIFTVTMYIKISHKHNPNINLQMNCLILGTMVYIIKVYYYKKIE